MRWRFIHIPRTGGTSFAEAYGRGTEESVPGMIAKSDKPVPNIPAHLPARFFPKEVVTFAFIRNPYERAFSMLGYLLNMNHIDGVPQDLMSRWKADGCPTIPEKAFCAWADLGFPCRNIASVHALHGESLSFLTPQVDYLRPDTIKLRYDRMEAETRRITEYLGLEYRPLPRMNAMLGRPQSVNGSAAKIIEEKWAADFEQLSEYWE